MAASNIRPMSMAAPSTLRARKVKVNTNTVEGFCSIFKRGTKGIAPNTTCTATLQSSTSAIPTALRWGLMTACGLSGRFQVQKAAV